MRDIKWLKEELDNYRAGVRKERKKLENITDHFLDVGAMKTRLDGALSALKRVREIIDQLDEPEVLSQEWIDERSYNIEEYWQVADMMDGPQYAVSVENLQNLLVPKQEEVDQAYKDGYEKGKQYTFYKGYLEGLADKENEPETVADVIVDFFESLERLKEVMSMEVEEMEE